MRSFGRRVGIGCRVGLGVLVATVVVAGCSGAGRGFPDRGRQPDGRTRPDGVPR